MKKKIISFSFVLFLLTSNAQAKALFVDLPYSLKSGLLGRILVKELCSCRFISGISLSNCLSRSNLGMPQILLRSYVGITEDENGLSVRTRMNGLISRAEFQKRNPQFGCKLVR